MRGFFRFVLRLLGILALMAGALVVLVTITMAPDDAKRFEALVGSFIFNIVLFGAGYLLLVWAEAISVPGAKPERNGSRLHKLGLVLNLILFWQLAVCLPRTGQIVMAVLLLLIFIRAHRPWSSKALIGRTTYADIFDSTIVGLGYLVVNMILAALTGGRAGAGGGSSTSGGGGSSGGGGASGRW